jgi:hypothetical protein
MGIHLSLLCFAQRRLTILEGGEGLRRLGLLLSDHAFVRMPFKGLFCFENFFFMLVDTISFSRFAQAKEEIWGIRLTCGHEEALKFGANAAQYVIAHLLSHNDYPNIGPPLNAHRAQNRCLALQELRPVQPELSQTMQVEPFEVTVVFQGLFSGAIFSEILVTSTICAFPSQLARLSRCHCTLVPWALVRLPRLGENPSHEFACLCLASS